MYMPKLKFVFNSNCCFLIVLMMLFGSYSLYLGQDFNWDLRCYHFYNAFAYLNHRRLFDIMPDGNPFYYAPTIDLLTYYLYTHFPPRVYAFVIGSLSGVSAFGVYLLTMSFLKQTQGLQKVILCICVLSVSLLGYANLMEVGASFGDNIASIFVIFSIYYLVKVYDENNIRDLIFSAALMGFAVALKLTMGPYGVAALFGLLFLKDRKYGSLIYFIFVSALVYVLVDLYWMIQQFDETGNPLYPYFQGLIDTNSSFQIDDPTFIPKTLKDTILFPFYMLVPSKVASERIMADPRILVAIMCCLLLILLSFVNPLKRKEKALVLICLVAHVFWLFLFAIARYAIVTEYLSGILLLILYFKLPFTEKIKTYIFILFVVVIVAFTRFVDWAHISFEHKFYKMKLPFNPSNALIFTNWQAQPAAFLIPAFHSSDLFVVEPMYLGYLPKTQLDKIDLKVNEYLQKGKSIYILAVTKWSLDTASLYTRYGLMVNKKRCWHSKGDWKVRLCELHRPK